MPTGKAALCLAPLGSFLSTTASRPAGGQRTPFSPSISVPSTGSSLMPQKKNPDSLELIRSKAGRVFGRVRRAGSGQGLWLTQTVLRTLPGWAARSSLLIPTLSSVCWAPDDPQRTSKHLQQGLTGVRQGWWRRDPPANTPVIRALPLPGRGPTELPPSILCTQTVTTLRALSSPSMWGVGGAERPQWKAMGMPQWGWAAEPSPPATCLPGGQGSRV